MFFPEKFDESITKMSETQHIQKKMNQKTFPNYMKTDEKTVLKLEKAATEKLLLKSTLNILEN
jgi:hypothetical protein